ncbi:MAG: mechanosensitive ion channel family protein [Candidatus Omnitrophica bacterium]|nr:mechanosensitive ion channel family protein [Candidatus Omnitrophota bacterium]MBU1996537.1 mechanosensitive ion channel family protein [Candidatus Omnitrophota bacterium]MBU4333977.1 mechanosensitive ion channel family protein [Candidatus Omnitrophota bacterium]
MSDYLFSGVLIASSFVIGWLLSFLVGFLIKRRDTLPLKWRKVNLELLKKPLRFLIPVLCVSVVIPFLRLPEKVGGFIRQLLHILFIALLGWVIVKIVCIIRDALLNRYDINTRDNVHARSMHTQIRLIANIIGVVLVLLTVSFVLMSFAEVRQIGVSLLASAGIMGIVIGFAAQKTLGNFIAGIQIAIAQPIRLDDVVIIENEWGWIEEITFTFVVVRIWDLRRLVVPISYFLEKPFQNWTRTSADILGSVFIYTDYTIPVKEVRAELTRILTNSQYWDKKVNVLQVTDAKEQVIELRALMSAADSPAAWNLRCEVREKLLEFLQNKFTECLPRVRIEMNKGESTYKRRGKT